MQKVLVVEDEKDIQNLLKFNLEKVGYETYTADSGEEGIDLAKQVKPDLILLDLMLPGVSGLGVCKTISEDDSLSDVSIIIVSARGEEHDIVTGLEMGAEDYIVKPFSLKVLLARAKKVLARKSKVTADQADETISFKTIQMDLKRHEVSVDSKQIILTSSEFAILRFLVEHPGWVFTRNQIVCAVHGDDYPVTNRSVDVMILGLRRKMGESGKLIETVRGVGYRFAD